MHWTRGQQAIFFASSVSHVWRVILWHSLRTEEYHCHRRQNT